MEANYDSYAAYASHELKPQHHPAITIANERAKERNEAIKSKFAHLIKEARAERWIVTGLLLVFCALLGAGVLTGAIVQPLH